MKTINLRNYYYPRYKEDVLVEVSDEVAEAIIRSVREMENLENLKTSGEPITPKKWQAEAEKLTAQKDLQYQQMKAIREEIKAVESLRKAAGREAVRHMRSVIPALFHPCQILRTAPLP